MASLRYPLQAYKGKLVTTEDYPTIIGDRILAAVQTQLEERVYVPDFGIEDATFKPVADLAAVLSDIRRSVAMALETDPEVAYDVLGSVQDNGSLYILVRYVCPNEAPREVSTSI